MDLPKAFPIFGNTQFKVLCVIASYSLAITLLISCLYIKERDPRLEGPPASHNPGVISFFRQVFQSIRRLPPQIRKVCEIQLAAWVGWFPFLFYSTTYIGQLYVNPIFEKHRDLSEDEINKTWEDATRIGTFALLIDAIVSFAANVILPLLVVPSYKRIEVPANLDPGVLPEEPEPELPRRMSFSGMPVGTASEPLLEAHARNMEEDKDEERNILSKLRIPGLTLRRTWLLSHLLFAICMFSTFFITSTEAAIAVIGIVGISWAVTLWAPFALISAEVAQRDAERRIQRLQMELGETRERSLPEPNNEHDSGPCENDDVEAGDIANDILPAINEDDEATDQAGIVLGLHNVAVSFPQFFSTLVSSLIFKALQKPRGEPWDDSVGWVMRFGGCAALVAAFLTKTLDEKRGK
jgi:solute carrier family 45 protein 1/2/4